MSQQLLTVGPVPSTPQKAGRPPLDPVPQPPRSGEVGPPGLAVGIDVGFAKGAPLPVVVARDVDGRIEPVSRNAFPRRPPTGRGNRALALADPGEGPATAFAQETSALLEEVAGRLGRPLARIAIDAPRGPAPAGRLRASEQAMADAGLRFIQTPEDLDGIRARARASAEAGAGDARLAEANRLWMVVGVALFEVLGQRFGPDRLMEVYPHAAFERLHPVSAPKRTPVGQSQRLRALARYAGWDSDIALRASVADAAWGSTHDKIDAYLCAVLAAKAKVEDSFQGAVADPADRIWMPPLGP